MTVSPQNIAATQASATDVAWLFLLRISGSPTQTPLYVVNNNEPIVSRGNVYQPFPFTVVLPPDDSEALPRVKLSLQNVDNSIIVFIREQLEPPDIAIELVTSAYPDIVEKSLTFLKLSSVTYDALVVEGSLDVDNFLSQRFPSEAYLPPQFPGLFR